MNNAFYPNVNSPLFTTPPNLGNNGNLPIIDLPFEQSYIENILRLNRGKKITIYASYADSIEWKDKKFKGIIEESGKDHIIISDHTTGKWYLILMIYVNYIEFDEKINYSQEFNSSN